MNDWFFHVDGKEIGPLDYRTAVQCAERHPDVFCWRRGFPEWLPASRVGELKPKNSAGEARQTPPPVPRARQRNDAIDFTICGHEMQFVEVELDPGESAVAEAGAMMYKDSSINMTTVFGDGSGQETGLFDKLVGAGQRVISGEGLFATVFTHVGEDKARIAFAAPYPGTILPVKLSKVGGRLICQKDAFLAAAKGVSIGIHFQKRILTGLFGGEGFVMQKLEGDGWVFLHCGGTVVERDLAAGETLHVDTGCLAALTDTVRYNVARAGSVKSMLFGGEGLFLATLTGPGRVWLQSLPFSRLAGRMLAGLSGQGGARGEGSIFGAMGEIVGGDGNW
jgi:uncharacterized protein (TIGR00266 family)